MTARKRKPPERKRKAQRGPGLALHGSALAWRGLALAGRLVSRNPRIFAGVGAFAVAFSFVAANALWYQPGAHPSPLLRTRLPFNNALAVRGVPPRKVTTFLIQREEEVATASIEQPQAAADIVPEPPAAGASLVTSIQKELVRRGLYDGPADGKIGPKTAAAIRHFEQLSGRAETGAASDALLAALQKQPAKQKVRTAALPAVRPSNTVEGGKGELDPVAAAIRDADINPDYIPKADIPASSELVMNIQKGLSNLAYSDVSIDGVAGEQTRTAIRHFEKHYRLPETGQPSDKVLKKMKEIGAL